MKQNYVTVTLCMHYDDDMTVISVANACARGQHVVRCFFCVRVDECGRKMDDCECNG